MSTEHPSAAVGPVMANPPSSLASATDGRRKFDYLPIGSFGSVMGLTGLSGAWQLAHNRFGAPEWVSSVIGATAVVTFVVICIAYGVKIVTAPRKVRDEFNHQITGNMFGTLTISLLLIPLVLVHVNLVLAQTVWIVGALSMILIAWIVVSRWISVPHDIGHVTPVWIVAIVGLLDLPMAVPVLHFPDIHALMVFGLAVGLVFVIPVFSLNIGRLMLGPPLPDALQPTLLMLAAPFPVGFSAYVLTVGHEDMFADSLYMLMLFVLAVIIGRLAVTLPGKAFKITWWATSFPLAASAIAALRFAGYHPDILSKGIACILLVGATLAITGLFVRTLVGLCQGKLEEMSA